MRLRDMLDERYEVRFEVSLKAAAERAIRAKERWRREVRTTFDFCSFEPRVFTETFEDTRIQSLTIRFTCFIMDIVISNCKAAGFPQPQQPWSRKLQTYRITCLRLKLVCIWTLSCA
ncbi:MAG: hypothetical protein ACTS4U_01240 [Candidatus Hodgkinia cicadicola]